MRSAMVLALVLSGACGGPQGTRSEQCYRSASVEQDRHLREMRLSRCDAMGLEERDVARGQHERRRAKQADTNARYDAETLRVRRDPQAPELGATNRESSDTCERQRGEVRRQVADGNARLRCVLGGRTIFVADMADGVAQRVAVYREDADAAAVRDDVVSRLGEAQEESTSNGYRIWQWRTADVNTAVTSYAHGAVLIVQASSL